MLGKLRDVLFILGKEKWACILSVKVCLCNFFFEKKRKKDKGTGKSRRVLLLFGKFLFSYVYISITSYY